MSVHYGSTLAAAAWSLLNLPASKPTSQLKLSQNYYPHLGLVGDLSDQTAQGHGRVKDKPVVEALVAHIPAEDAAVGGQARDRDAHVVINLHRNEWVSIDGPLGGQEQLKRIHTPTHRAASPLP